MVQDIKQAVQNLKPTGQLTKNGIEFSISLENTERLEEIFRMDEAFEGYAKGLF